MISSGYNAAHCSSPSLVCSRARWRQGDHGLMPTREERNLFNAAAQELGAAAARGDIATVDAILAARPRLALHTRPFTDACKYGQPTTLEALLRAGGRGNEAFPAGPTERTWRGLHAAVRTPGAVRWSPGHVQVVELLLDQGGDVNDGADRGFITPLGWAAQQGNHEAAELLLARGARVGFHEALMLGHAEQVRETLERQPELATEVFPGLAANAGHPVTALHFAAISRLGTDHPVTALRLGETAELLVAAGTPPVATMHQGKEVPGPIAAAGEADNATVLRVLLAHGAVAAEALPGALMNTALKVLEVLAGYPIDVNAGGDPKLGNRLLHEMVRWGRLRSALWLLDHGANATVPDAYGWAPLHYAARRGGPLDLVIALLDHGADVDAHNQAGHTALNIARRHRRYQTVALLEEHAAR